MTHEAGSGGLGLRERKKQATREAIGNAALRLALEHGPQNVRVDDIVAAAGVSPRTFNNYFSSREEAIWAPRVDQIVRLASALRDRPTDEPVDVALRAVLLEQAVVTERDKDLIRRIAAVPALRAEYLRGITQVEEAFSEFVAQRTGAAAHDLGPRLIAGAYAVALRVASGYWLTAEGDPALLPILAEALDRVAPVARGLDRC
ncbi:TetR family transcriptional regulator [Cryptosporangium aurantiacum]|uniref:Transcriptional regulator, TetR family n=1 Tax=Cryptosporangium aurantiacum TaxID=134849 RepID=A0A1M7PCF1_9ACTN|nr:TetR family transcriptional regulator [Cryptosporangium aurantiacum]SHN14596.1 transcriptional regulator, TetR family [Cryptosporangium aurantiacum]